MYTVVFYKKKNKTQTKTEKPAKTCNYTNKYGITKFSEWAGSNEKLYVQQINFIFLKLNIT